jgi:hypothetical protein
MRKIRWIIKPVTKGVGGFDLIVFLRGGGIINRWYAIYCMAKDYAEEIIKLEGTQC